MPRARAAPTVFSPPRAVLHYKHVNGEDMSGAPDYDDPAREGYECSFGFKDFVELVTGGHLEELVIHDICDKNWLANKPRSVQTDLVCRWLFPPTAVILSALILGVPTHRWAPDP